MGAVERGIRCCLCRAVAHCLNQPGFADVVVRQIALIELRESRVVLREQHLGQLFEIPAVITFIWNIPDIHIARCNPNAIGRNWCNGAAGGNRTIAVTRVGDIQNMRCLACDFTRVEAQILDQPLATGNLFFHRQCNGSLFCRQCFEAKLER
ncbi:hypothetical protein D3C80_1096350 [compost metagenome]